jgi:Fe-Mn family superoxide dismutase
MQKQGLTRRDVLTKAVPAAAIAGIGLGAMAQPAAAPQQNTLAQQLFSDGLYTLPPLPFEPNALDPHISAQILQIHHGKHHQAYVTNLNKAVAKLDEVVRGGAYDQVQLDGLLRDISFNGGGHMLHSLYWATMAPPSGSPNAPQGVLADAINMQFGSFDQFKAFFTRAAVTAKGSGWALLIYEPFSDGLGVLQVGDHDMRVVPGMLPILTVDVWEHAYYLQYQNNREQYVNAWWNVVNWAAVTEMFTSFRHQRHPA